MIRNMPKSIEDLIQCELSTLIKIFDDMDLLIKNNKKALSQSKNQLKTCEDFLRKKLDKTAEASQTQQSLFEGLRIISGGNNDLLIAAI